MRVAVSGGPGGQATAFENVDGVAIGIVYEDRTAGSFVGAKPKDLVIAAACLLAEVRRLGGAQAIAAILELSQTIDMTVPAGGEGVRILGSDGKPFGGAEP